MDRMQLVWFSSAFSILTASLMYVVILISVTIKVPLWTRLRLRQMLISYVQCDLNEVHEPRLYTTGLTRVKLSVSMSYARLIQDCLHVSHCSAERWVQARSLGRCDGFFRAVCMHCGSKWLGSICA